MLTDESAANKELIIKIDKYFIVLFFEDSQDRVRIRICRADKKILYGSKSFCSSCYTIFI